MKKIIFALLLVSVFVFTGCEEIFDIIFDTGNTSYSYDMVTATESKSYTYSSSYPIFEVSPTTKNITISGVTSGKSVYVAKVNTGNYSVSLSHIRSVGTDSSTGYRVATASETKSLEKVEAPESKYKHFHAPEISFEKVQSEARNARAVSNAAISTQTQISRTVGTTKNIYVDSEVGLKTYKSASATLRAVGTYCNVWIVDDYYTAGPATGAKVNTSIAKTFADKFDSFYPIVRNIFGQECDNIIYTYSTASTLKEASDSYPMSSYSDTGTIVNIVLYDIGADSNLEQTNQCGVLGYFYAKDYYSQSDSVSNNIKYSNQGKYFYVDSAYSVSDFETVISTLAHEFQHMVNFGVKNVEKGLSSGTDTKTDIESDIDTAYNEMLSMLCEDMMSSHLGLTDSNNVKNERLPTFNTTYFISGIREYLDTYSAFSYSTSYGFGSWLCRQYGGAALVKEIMSNSYAGNESLVVAVNSLNNKSYTFNELFQQFLLACTNGGSTSGYTHNQNAKQTVSYTNGSTTYIYPMTAINLWESAYSYNEDKFYVNNQKTAAYNTNASSWSGPFLFSNAYGVALRPNYGITLHKLGTTESNTLSLTFSSSGADCVTMYVIIQ